MKEFAKQKITLVDGEVFEVNGTETGDVHVEYYLDGGKGSLTLNPAETQDLYEALRMALEEAQAALPKGPVFERDDYLRVVAMSAGEAVQFLGMTHPFRKPIDLGPADSTRYCAGARVWGFKFNARKAHSPAFEPDNPDGTDYG
jgi:hypothetical protein